MNAPVQLASVESAADPGRPGRTAHVIIGSTAAAVQDAIDTLSRTVDGACGGAPGIARFIGPCRVDGEWRAVGEVIMTEAA
jgi:hypothetical protein